MTVKDLQLQNKKAAPLDAEPHMPYDESDREASSSRISQWVCLRAVTATRRRSLSLSQRINRYQEPGNGKQSEKQFCIRHAYHLLSKPKGGPPNGCPSTIRREKYTTLFP